MIPFTVAPTSATPSSAANAGQYCRPNSWNLFTGGAGAGFAATNAISFARFAVDGRRCVNGASPDARAWTPMDLVELRSTAARAGVKDATALAREMDAHANIERRDRWGLVASGGEVCGAGRAVTDFFGAAKRNGSSWLRLMMLNTRR
jgi:hypothetical protein